MDEFTFAMRMRVPNRISVGQKHKKETGKIHCYGQTQPNNKTEEVGKNLKSKVQSKGKRNSEVRQFEGKADVSMGRTV